MEYCFLFQFNLYVELFFIYEKEVILYIVKQIDREIVCKFEVSCIFRVDVIVRFIGNFYQKIQFNFNILDINDNNLIFFWGFIDVELFEGLFVGMFV